MPKNRSADVSEAIFDVAGIKVTLIGCSDREMEELRTKILEAEADRLERSRTSGGEENHG